MSQIIVYKVDGRIVWVAPSEEALEALGIDEVAARAVPAGLRYKIMNTADLPTTPQAEWSMNDSEFTSGIGCHGTAPPPPPAPVTPQPDPLARIEQLEEILKIRGILSDTDITNIQTANNRRLQQK